MSKYGPRIKKMFNKFFEDNCIYYAAASCFFLIVCFLPFLLLLLNVLSFFPVQLEDLQKIVNDSAPEQVVILINGLLSDIFQKKSFAITSISTIFMVYASGQGFMAIMQAFDKIYKCTKKVSWIRRRIKSTLYTFLFMFVIVIVVIMYVYGSIIAKSIEPSNPEFAAVMRHIVVRRYLYVPAILLVLFTLMYMYVPNRRGRFWDALPGGVVATIGGMIFSFIYSLIISHSPQFNYMYGSLANVIFALFWLFALLLIVFFGAEFNTYIENKWIILPKWMRVSQWGKKKDKNDKKNDKTTKERNKSIEKKKGIEKINVTIEKKAKK